MRLRHCTAPRGLSISITTPGYVRFFRFSRENNPPVFAFERTAAHFSSVEQRCISVSPLKGARQRFKELTVQPKIRASYCCPRGGTHNTASSEQRDRESAELRLAGLP